MAQLLLNTEPMKFIIGFALILATTYGRIITKEELCFHCEDPPGNSAQWYTDGVFYQIYPRSFMDADNDGNGDLKGIRMRLGHLKDLGVTGVWLSPIFLSPQKDGGYDIQSYIEVDPMYGTMQDLDDLILEAKRLGIKLILDFVPNHTSDQHEWFIKSLGREEPYTDFYVWDDGKECLPEEEWDEESGVVPCKPPSNWVSRFAGPMWEWKWERGQFYLHQFVVAQPDVNFDNPRVREEFKAILEFWMDRGIDGFRVDAITHAYEVEGFPDENVLLPWGGGDPTRWEDIWHNYTKDLPQSFELVYDWRDVMDHYSLVNEIEPKLMMTEAYPLLPENVFKWFGDPESGRLGGQMAFNFIFISNLNRNSTAKDFVELINLWLENVPDYASPNWVLGNHDRDRVATRFNPEWALGLAFMEFTLPGYAVVYQGEELGMINNYNITWEQSEDPQGCNTNKTDFLKFSRDPIRTPFQWDSSTNAGFNSGKDPWLPIHENYKTVNLESEKNQTDSFYRYYKDLIRLRKEPVFRYGVTKVHAFEENVLAVLRSHEDEHYVTVINFNGGEEAVSVDLTQLMEEANNLQQAMMIMATPKYNPDSEVHAVVSAKNFRLGPYDAVIVKMTSSAASVTLSIGLLLLSLVNMFSNP